MRITQLLCILEFALATAVVNASYSDRQEQMRDIVLRSGSTHTPVVESFQNVSISEGLVNKVLVDLDQDQDAAFDIVILIRILGFGGFAIDSPAKQNILDTLVPIPFWLEPNEDTRVYWTENQMIMWMSSEWLLQENYPTLKQYSSNLRDRLIHYLQMKIDWGFSEFFSSIYFPFTLSGLLNLVDFCKDTNIQALAEQVSQELLRLILLVSNDQGQFLAASARNNAGYYTGEPAVEHIIWLLRGVGPTPCYAHQSTAFLCTSSLPVSSDVIGWYTDGGFQGSVRTGPSLSESKTYNSGLSREERTIFQWSMGGYFAADVIADTQHLVDTYNLGNHGGLEGLSVFESIPPFFANMGTQLLSSVSESSVISGFNIDIFRDGPSVLSSAKQFWPGRMGFQSFPWMATTGTLPVWTQSGTVDAGWSKRSPSNTHLPLVIQDSNVALIMYNRKNDLSLVGDALDFEVSLYWPQFYEERQTGGWRIGHEQQSGGYIAVRPHCADLVNGVLACKVEHQTWAVVVGNSQSHGTFQEFVDKVQLATYEYSYKWSWRRFRNVFKGKVEFGGILIEHEW